MEHSEKITLIGVDLGGTKVAAAKVSDFKAGEIINKPVPAKSENPRDVINVVIDVIDTLFDHSVKGIGIGIPGLIDRKKGVVNDVQNIPSWKEVRLKEILENSLDSGADEISIDLLDGGKTLIEVSDNGKGIDSDDI